MANALHSIDSTRSLDIRNDTTNNALQVPMPTPPSQLNTNSGVNTLNRGAGQPMANALHSIDSTRSLDIRNDTTNNALQVPMPTPPSQLNTNSGVNTLNRGACQPLSNAVHNIVSTRPFNIHNDNTNNSLQQVSQA
eukprot:1135742_1